jgi:hypothetical protein
MLTRILTLPAGRVILDRENKPRMEYTIDTYDANSLTLGTVASAEIHLIAGARRIATTQVDVEDYIPQAGHQYLADPAWKEWVAKVEKAGTYPGRCAIGSAHQMGSNQMGSKPSTSVVDSRGRVWGTEGLYVADAVSFNFLCSPLSFGSSELTDPSTTTVRVPDRFGSEPDDHRESPPVNSLSMNRNKRSNSSSRSPPPEHVALALDRPIHRSRRSRLSQSTPPSPALGSLRTTSRFLSVFSPIESRRLHPCRSHS